MSGTDRGELVEQPILAAETESRHSSTLVIAFDAVSMLHDVTEQRSQHRRMLEVDELGPDDEVGHASSMAEFG